MAFGLISLMVNAFAGGLEKSLIRMAFANIASFRDAHPVLRVIMRLAMYARTHRLLSLMECASALQGLI